ncbi:CDP-alcohol phosphatidyltransferase family protein [Solicola sp. PLA-1-18]|uniref:CDP-alcohol phosphatidyltransferase family protein n=1 Tax=Solicola sp. PLA-1-18 TaxID=3380532 RepID=UPI003B7845BF
MTVPSEDAAWSRAHGGLDPSSSMWVAGWLRMVRWFAAPLVRRGVTPDAVTLTGVAVSAVVPLLAWAGDGWLLLAAVVALAAAVVDGIDGAVAVATDTASAWGRVLDPLADRVSDLLFLTALWLLGSPAWLCVLLGALTLLHESVRSSGVAAGLDGVGAVTVWERPSRVIVTIVVSLACGSAAVLPLPGWAPADPVGLLASAGAAVGLVLAVVGFVHLVVAVRRQLRGCLTG